MVDVIFFGEPVKFDYWGVITVGQVGDNSIVLSTYASMIAASSRSLVIIFSAGFPSTTELFWAPAP